MVFYKTARVDSYGSAEYEAGGLLKIAGRIATAAQHGPAHAPAPSYYLDGSRKIGVGDLLSRVAETYAISDDPRHYIYEAIRANTTNAPNENSDGFHRSELLRFDTRLGMAVYMTYAGKPHHVNHKTENPKTARGVIIDSHYHDEQPALESCPQCQTRTAERRNRDESGLHCKRCGYLVKDEFVEILVGVDTRKDPDFARGVRTGQLNAGSMGCNCISTTCNVCHHVAFSRPEFCEHIRAGNKGTLWKRQGQLWVRTNALEIQREASKHGYRWDPTDFCYLQADARPGSRGGGFEARKAFEYCNQVVFDEYSRVDQPADPKAKQREILNTRLASRTASLSPQYFTPGYVPTASELQAETEGLMRAADAHRKSASKRRAEKFCVIRVNKDDADIHAGMTVEEAMDLAGLDPDDHENVEVCEVEAENAVEACEKFDAAKAHGVNDKEGDIVVQAPPDEPVRVEQMRPEDSAPGAPGALGTPPQSIENYQEEEMPGPESPGAPSDEQLSPAEMGVVPPGAGIKATRRPVMRFAQMYKDWSVDVSPQGNARILNAAKQPMLIVRGPPEADPQKRYAFGKRVMMQVLTDGLTVAGKKLNALCTPKVAQVVDGAIDDMKEFADKYMHSSTRDNYADDMADARDKPPAKTPDDADDDMQDARGKPPQSTQDDGAVDHSEGVPSGVDSATQEDNTDMADKRDKLNLGSDSVLDNEIHDHAERVARLTRLGAKIAHKQLPNVAWTVRSAALSREGAVVVLEAMGQRSRRVAEKDLLTYWKSLDAKPNVRRAEDEGCDDEDDDKPDFLKKEKEARQRQAKAQQAFVERHKKATEARVAKLKKEHAKELKQHGKIAVEAFCRAMRIAAHRQLSHLEQSPLEETAVRVLASPQGLCVDPTSGQGIEYAGMGGDLARYLVAQVLQQGQGQHLEGLMNRAAALASKGDQYLLDAELDLQNLRPALPPVTAAMAQIASPETMHARQMRHEAAHGNFALNAVPPVEAAPQNGTNKRTAIRGAVQGTLTAENLGRLRALN